MRWLFPENGAGAPVAPLRRQDPFWWLRDRDALIRRFVFSQVLDEPRAKRAAPSLRDPRRRR